IWDLTLGRLHACWSALDGQKEAESKDATKTLTATPKQAVPFLKERLGSAARLEKEVRALAAALNDPQFKARDKAASDMEALGLPAAFALRQILDEQPALEVRKRVELLLKRLEQTGAKKAADEPTGAAATADGQRIRRAFEVLEQIGTPEARQV